MDADELQAVEAAKEASVAQLLFRAARLWNDLGVAQVRAASGVPFRVAHTRLFPHIDMEGTRLTELARRLGVSKQAVAQLVDELVEHGALEKVRDPSDGRARLIRFASGGLLAGLGALQETERDLAQALPPGTMGELRGILLQLLPLLEKRAGG